jgi:hypothetical protein
LYHLNIKCSFIYFWFSSRCRHWRKPPIPRADCNKANVAIILAVKLRGRERKADRSNISTKDGAEITKPPRVQSKRRRIIKCRKTLGGNALPDCALSCMRIYSCILHLAKGLKGSIVGEARNCLKLRAIKAMIFSASGRSGSNGSFAWPNE